MTKIGLPPIINKSTKIIILGSFPSDESIRQNKYYAKTSNDFWKLISETIGENILEFTYEGRIKKLQEHGIGLWDIFHDCNRIGSLDSNIKSGVVNDFSSIYNVASGLRLVCLNGKEAGRYEKVFSDKGYQTKLLLSSSGANRARSEERRIQWKSLLRFV